LVIARYYASVDESLDVFSYYVNVSQQVVSGHF